MTGLADGLAVLCTAGGLVAGLVVLGASRDPRAALRVALEFWTAAGLLRLAGPPTWPRLAAATAVVALRQVLGLGLRRAARPTAPSG